MSHCPRLVFELDSKMLFQDEQLLLGEASWVGFGDGWAAVAPATAARRLNLLLAI